MEIPVSAESEEWFKQCRRLVSGLKGVELSLVLCPAACRHLNRIPNLSDRSKVRHRGNVIQPPFSKLEPLRDGTPENVSPSSKRLDVDVPIFRQHRNDLSS
jgi:hypothetical protein